MYQFFVYSLCSYCYWLKLCSSLFPSYFLPCKQTEMVECLHFLFISLWTEFRWVTGWRLHLKSWWTVIMQKESQTSKFKWMKMVRIEFHSLIICTAWTNFFFSHLSYPFGVYLADNLGFIWLRFVSNHIPIAFLGCNLIL